jgi:hypothetical protein
MTICNFDLRRLTALRRRVERAQQRKEPPPAGWSKSAFDPVGVVNAFDALRLRTGFTIRAYQYYCAGNGHAVVWAMPAGSDFPEPQDCSVRAGGSLEPPRPPGALDDVMEVIEGDGSPWSHISASLFWREIREFGAYWHGCDWSSHSLLDRNPLSVPARGRQRGVDWPSGRARDWHWLRPEPADWRPAVRRRGASVTVTFCTFNAAVRQKIARHSDRYESGSYCFVPTVETLATGPSGFIY